MNPHVPILLRQAAPGHACACDAAPSASVLGLFQSQPQTIYHSTCKYFSKNVKLLTHCRLTIDHVQRRACSELGSWMGHGGGSLKEVLKDEYGFWQRRFVSGEL